MVQSKFVRRTSGPAAASTRPSHAVRASSADLPHRPNRRDLWRVTVKPDEEEEDVIDLGAPRAVRLGRSLGPAPQRPICTYTPNPRLYPGPQKLAQAKQKSKPNGSHRQRKKHAFRRPVPNSRLYRPAPPRPPPPPAYPRTVWRPPAQENLETASRVALRISHGLWSPPSKRPSVNTIAARPPSRNTVPRKSRRPSLRTRKSPTCSPARCLKCSSTPSPARLLKSPPTPSPSETQKLVITLPAAGDGNSPLGQTPSQRQEVVHYKPASQHFRDRRAKTSGDSTPTGGRVIQVSALSNMDSTPRHSTSPEDCSEGNDSHSAPSEFLAEFLSAIMRRQYAEALKYCRLILQYEPRNATARGFYPLLQQKLAQQSPQETRDKSAPRARHHRSPRVSRSPELSLAGGSSGGNSGESSPVPPGILPHEVMEQEADSLSCSERPGSAGSSDAEPGLDSVSSQSSLELDSSEPARSSPSLSLSRRTDRTDSASASGTWDSSGSRDDNGNLAPLTEPRPCCDAENNPPVSAAAPAPAPAPAPAARTRPHTLQSEQSTESLRRLRAQFTCSIK